MQVQRFTGTDNKNFDTCELPTDFRFEYKSVYGGGFSMSASTLESRSPANRGDVSRRIREASKHLELMQTNTPQTPAILSPVQ